MYFPRRGSHAACRSAASAKACAATGRLRAPRREGRAATQNLALGLNTNLGEKNLNECCYAHLRRALSSPSYRRHPALDGAAGGWRARWAPDMVGPHGLKPCSAAQSLRGLPADVCPLPRGRQRVPGTDPSGRFGTASSRPRTSAQGRDLTTVPRSRRTEPVGRFDDAGQLTFAGAGPGHYLSFAEVCFGVAHPSSGRPVR